MQKSVTVYIPAGMRIPTFSDELSSILFANRKSTSEKRNCDKIFQANNTSTRSDISNKHSSHEPQLNVSTVNGIGLSKKYSENDRNGEHSNIMKPEISVPKTICKNKKNGPKKNNFETDEKSGSDVRINSTEISPTEADYCNNHICEDSNASCGQKSEIQVQNSFDNSRTEIVNAPSKSLLLCKLQNRAKEKDSENKADNQDQINKYKKLKQLSEHINMIRNKQVRCDKIRKNVETKTAELKPDLQKKCHCENCDGIINCPKWCDNNIKFDEVINVKKASPLLKNSNNEDAKITKVYNKTMVIHGVILPKPVKSLDETYFDPNVQKALLTMKCTAATNMQSYAWPCIQRSLNLFMVGTPQSGKTLSYLPAICTFTLERSGRYLEFSKYKGPLTIILCSSSKKCREVYDLAVALTEYCRDDARVEVVTNSSITADINCDILVTEPPILEACLKSELVNLKRLCHLALEDANLLLKYNNKCVEKLLKILNIVQTNRPHNKNIQIIASSEKWSPDLEVLMKAMYISPVLCFEDFVEASAYSKIIFLKKKLHSGHKKFYLEDILKKQFSTRKSIIFCNDGEISDIYEYLEMKGIECILISPNLTDDDNFENENMWCSLKIGRYKVLICTDQLFEKAVRIVNANWIFHFSLPSNWKIFQNRFRSLSANLHSPLDAEETLNSETENNFSFLLSDETCNNQIFADFLEVLNRNAMTYFHLK